MPDIRHDPDASRFVADAEGGEAELAYQRDGDVIVFVHTFVPEASRGQGLGEALAQAGLDYARSEGLTVRPDCPFVAAYIEDHPEAQGLLA